MLLRSLAWLGFLGFALGGIGSVQAQQVVPDSSLNTQVTRSGDAFTITGGSTAGTNLFHSFREFSVPTRGSAIFNNATTIQNIFSRVTGGSVSNIDGAIRANGTANLFLLNPSGILFGPNASLNIGGSFIGTTANSIKFADGVEFSATNATGTPLLTMSVPVGLQMGQNPGAITVNNTGHQLTGSISATLTNRAPNLVGLQVVPGQTLALVGGDLTLNGGVLTVPGGQVDLRAIGQQSTLSQVGLQMINGRWQLIPDQVLPTGQIRFLNRAFVNANGTGRGGVQLWGGNLIMQDGSVVSLENRGSQASGTIELHITNAIDLIGAAPNTILASGIYADARSAGRGSNILVNTQKLTLKDGGALLARAYATGDSGSVTINASSIDFFDSQRNDILGTIGSRTRASGNGNDVTINTEFLRIHGGGIISSAVTGNGNGSRRGGNILINASESVELRLFSSESNDAVISASAVSKDGDAGNITLNTSRLLLDGGALISSSVYGTGTGGTITVNAAESVSLNGRRFSPSRLTSEGSSIRAAGVLLPNRAAFSLPNEVTGLSGNVVINTPTLTVTDGAEIVVSHESVGNAGTLQINADTLALDRNGQLSATTTSGEGGNIVIESARLLTLRNGSSIITTAGGKGNGGNITINAPIILGLENSDIIANAVGGRGGNINIITQGIIGLEFRNTLTPRTDITNDITASSQFSLNGTVQINNIGVDPTSGISELPTELVDASQQVASQCAAKTGSRFVLTGRGGILQDPTQASQTYHPWQDLRPVAAEKPAGTIAQTPKPESTLLEATGLQVDDYGAIALIAAPQTEPSSLHTATCSSTPVARTPETAG
jgi:filamentous hemagglutinin family protein